MTASVRVLPQVTADIVSRKLHADKLRRLADTVESGETEDFILMARTASVFEAMTSTGPYEGIILARMLDHWAVGKVMTA